MASNPFGITQVDIPGLLGLHQQMKANRLDELYRAKQMEIQEKQLERQDRKEEAMARVFAKGGDQSSGGTGTAMQPPASDAPASSLPALDQPLPARADGLSINMEALRDLYAIDPQSAQQIQKLVHEANDQQLKDATKRGEAMAIAAGALKSLPAGERQAQFQSRWAPWLAERGWTPDLLRKADMGDASLDAYYRQGMSLQQIIGENEPKYLAPQPGSPLVNVRDPNAIAQYNRQIVGGNAELPSGFVIDGGPTPSASGDFPGN